MFSIKFGLVGIRVVRCFLLCSMKWVMLIMFEVFSVLCSSV